MTNEKPNVFVFGPTGNLGPTWVETAVEEGWNVIGLGLGKPDKPFRSLMLDSIELDLMDLKKSELMESFSKYKPSTIIFNSGIDSPPGH